MQLLPNHWAAAWWIAFALSILEAGIEFPCPFLIPGRKEQTIYEY
jgi:hypothetical protein